MAHNEKRTVWWKEAIIGGIVGLQYGFIGVVIGHPFDTVKTKMQAVEEYKNLSFRKSFLNIYSSISRLAGS